MTQYAKIRWMESGEPFSEQFQDFYFSTDGGFEETEYVFLKQNNLPQAFIDLANIDITSQKNHTRKNLNSFSLWEKAGMRGFKIAETGFGTGLNFLITAMHWMQTADVNSTLEYTSIEKYPLRKVDLKQIFSIFKKNWPKLSLYCNELHTHYPAEFSEAQIQLSLFNGRIILNLLIEDATSALKKLSHTLNDFPDSKINAWYLDGFSPAKNPAMWNSDLFSSIANLSKVGTTLATFSSAGIVRRGLQEAGFSMTKMPGLGKKREILSGVMLASNIQTSS